MKNILNISINREQLKEYLADFHPSKIEEVNNIFEEEYFNLSKTVFKGFMKSKIGMPKIGKSTINYWVSRGWDELEAEEKRIKPKIGTENSPMSIIYWINRGLTEEQAKYKVNSFRKTNKEYWLSRGYSEEKSIENIKEFQTLNNNKFQTKLKNNDKFNRMVKSKQNTNIDYWINKGYSKEECCQKLKERQSTFSLTKCIEKYGYINGKIRWEERQNKWLNSMSISNYNGIDGKDNKSITYYKQNFGNSWVDKFIENNSFKNKSEIKTLISFPDYREAIDYLLSDKLSISQILAKIKSKLFIEIFNCKYEDMFAYLVSKPFIIKNKFGFIRYFNGHICRSNGEYMLANFLVENNINYKYEKKYPNSKYISDFYLHEHDIYVEYLGMKWLREENYQKKKNFCTDNKINHIYSDNIEEIKTLINEIRNNFREIK
jgi:hypothetical protein